MEPLELGLATLEQILEELGNRMASGPSARFVFVTEKSMLVGKEFKPGELYKIGQALQFIAFEEDLSSGN